MSGGIWNRLALTPDVALPFSDAAAGPRPQKSDTLAEEAP